MNIPQTLIALVSELGQHLGLNALRLDETGGCALEFDQRHTLSLQYRETENELWLYVDLGAVRERTADSYERLLQANLFWQMTMGATLSLSGDTPPHVVLARALHWQGMDGSALGATVTAFLHTTEDWAENLDSADTGEAPFNTAGMPLNDIMDALRTRA